jgi:hypothetical protein
MEVKALINEQSITQIEGGMPVEIRVDALNNTKFKGVVTKVNQYAESNNMWGGSGIRKYAVFIRILDPSEELKPGMNSSCTIQTKYEPAVLTMPIQCVYGVGDKQFALVKAGDNFETRELKVGGENGALVWVQEGVKEGEEAVMNPGAYKERMNLPPAQAESKIDLPENAKAEIEAAKKSASAGGPGPAAGGPGAGGPAGGGAPGGPGGGAGGGGRRGGAGGGGPGGGMDMNAMVQRTLDRYDTNKDNKIDKTELEALDERARGFVERSDSNGDGEITKAEIESSMKAMMERFQNGGGAGGGGGGGFGGGGGGGGQ